MGRAVVKSSCHFLLFHIWGLVLLRFHFSSVWSIMAWTSGYTTAFSRKQMRRSGD